MPSNIVHIISSYDVFGPEKIIISESLFLGKKGYRVIIVVLRPRGTFPFLEKVRRKGISCYHLVSSAKFDIYAILRLIKFLSQIKCQLVHCNGYKADVFGFIACRLLGIPVITTIHGWTSENLKVRFYEKIQLFCWRFFDKIICVSEFYRKKALQSGISDKKLSLIYNSIVADDYAIDDIKNKRLLFKIQYEIPSDHFLIGIIGRLSVEKGHKYFLEAAYQVLKKEDKVSFLIIGEGVERENIEQMRRRLCIDNHVYMLGHIDDVRRIYSVLDAVVIASLREGLPLVLLESLVCEIPVIATDVGGIPEVISNNEEGLLVSSMNSLAIADALLNLIRHPDLRDRFVNRGRKKVMSQFSFKRRMEKIEKLYYEFI